MRNRKLIWAPQAYFSIFKKGNTDSSIHVDFNAFNIMICFSFTCCDRD